MVSDLEHLPGGELVAKGLEDLVRGEETVEALLVAIAAPRLRRVGIQVPAGVEAFRDAELRLYRLLRVQRPADAYSFYNSLLRRLVSCESALEREWAARELRRADQ